MARFRAQVRIEGWWRVRAISLLLRTGARLRIVRRERAKRLIASYMNGRRVYIRVGRSGSWRYLDRLKVSA